MLVQIYEISSSQEAAALGALGVDHIGVLVGDGSFPRERPLDTQPFDWWAEVDRRIAVARSGDRQYIGDLLIELVVELRNEAQAVTEKLQQVSDERAQTIAALTAQLHGLRVELRACGATSPSFARSSAARLTIQGR